MTFEVAVDVAFILVTSLWLASILVASLWLASILVASLLVASTLEASLFRVLFSGIAAAGVVSAVIDVVGKPFAWRECGECGMSGRALASSVVLRRSRAGRSRVDSIRLDSFRADCF